TSQDAMFVIVYISFHLMMYRMKGYKRELLALGCISAARALVHQGSYQRYELALLAFAAVQHKVERSIGDFHDAFWDLLSRFRV
ncbi:MAG: hypothetical protein PV344_08800, partial [Anaplasma sp.]|nr:hypothetical protein [Anaplasma sp.]